MPVGVSCEMSEFVIEENITKPISNKSFYYCFENANFIFRN